MSASKRTKLTGFVPRSEEVKSLIGNHQVKFKLDYGEYISNRSENCLKYAWEVYKNIKKKNKPSFARWLKMNPQDEDTAWEKLVSTLLPEESETELNFIISGKWNDILRIGQSKHYSSCSTHDPKTGELAPNLMGPTAPLLCMIPNIGILYIADKAGKYENRVLFIIDDKKIMFQKWYGNLFYGNHVKLSILKFFEERGFHQTDSIQLEFSSLPHYAKLYIEERNRDLYFDRHFIRYDTDVKYRENSKKVPLKRKKENVIDIFIKSNDIRELMSHLSSFGVGNPIIRNVNSYTLQDSNRKYNLEFGSIVRINLKNKKWHVIKSGPTDRMIYDRTNIEQFKKFLDRYKSWLKYTVEYNRGEPVFKLSGHGHGPYDVIEGRGIRIVPTTESNDGWKFCSVID